MIPGSPILLAGEGFAIVSAKRGDWCHIQTEQLKLTSAGVMTNDVAPDNKG